MTYTQAPSGVWEKHFPLNSLDSTSGKLPLFARVCFSKKYQTGKNSLAQNSSTKHPRNAIWSTQHLNPVSRATSKWPIKICGTWLVIKRLYCFFANHNAAFTDNWIIFSRFCTLFTYRLFTVRYFSLSSSRSTALHYGRPYILDLYQIYFLASLPPHSKPRLDLETALLLSAN